ncbi:phosphoserine phosphatase SerB [Croceibacterium sp. TMG7-5b_MA50]|uniref:phosphoserine phosphatase SerB n=1 Tax=Croceibacterium sp. TMG7-5b_MA50 TaxID=3121290 RepID=UPI0032217832
MLIARLIADPATLDRRLDAAAAALADKGLALAGASLLDHWSDVLELMLPGNDLPTLKTVIRDHFDPSDAIIAREEIRVPDLFVSDMDSTMIGQECIDELADFAGLKDQVAAITERAMQGELDFAAALHERVGLLAGLEETAIGTCLDTRIHPVPGARVLVATLRHRGCRTVLVTGGFHHFADHVAEQLGFDRVVGNRLSVAEGRLDGKLAGPIADAASKERTLREELSLLGEQAVSMAAGDGANDIPMLRTATYGIAYRAKPAAREAANGWVERGELTALLKLMGIPEHEWVAG